jgi:hypothetical protein
VRRRSASALLLGLLVGCGGDESCPEGELLRSGACEPYTPAPPLEATEDLWLPAPGTSWQWQLSGAVDTSVDVRMYDLDLFDVADEVLDELRDRDRAVVCYFSAGSHEDWREDAGEFPEEAIGRPLDGWPGERWLDVRNGDVRYVLARRLDTAAERRCDAVEPDNVDGYTNGTGFPLTATEQLDFNRWLADQAHLRGLSVGLKNDLEQVGELVDWFDWALNEECVTYEECDRLAPFTDGGKAAFHVEYVDDFADAPALAEEVCGVGPDLDTLVKTWDLGPERLACP